MRVLLLPWHAETFRRRNSTAHTIMKTFATLLILAAGLTLSSCKSCPFAPKKADCAVGCTKPCCAKKAADCKSCKP